MKKTQTAVRILLGLMLVIFGLNKFVGFMPLPAMAEPAGIFMGALAASGYVLPIVAVVEILVGILCFANRYQPLALVVLFPVMLNAFLFHLFLDPAGIGGAALVLGMNVFLLFSHREAFAALLRQH